MWPWEHIAVGYLLYSGYVHLSYGESPGTLPALAVLFGALFPDLIDKPLAWSFKVVASGISVTHSLFTAVALSAVSIVVLDRLGHRQVGTGFSIAYLAHLPSDAIYPVLLGSPLHISPYFWPLTTATGAVQGGFLENFVYYFTQFLAFLATPQGLLFLGLEVALIGTTVLVWISDECPGLSIVPGLGNPVLD